MKAATRDLVNNGHVLIHIQECGDCLKIIINSIEVVKYTCGERVSMILISKNIILNEKHSYYNEKSVSLKTYFSLSNLYI
jgi:hypothetical protein